MAYPFKVILSPLEFDENSLAALEAARQIALECNATIYLLHVIPLILVPGEGYIVYSVEEQERNAKARLADIANAQLKGVNHQILVQIGDRDTATSILRAADELDADLIVMATHGRTGLPHFFIGSVAEKVVREASCPVLTIRPAGGEKPALPPVHG